MRVFLLNILLFGLVFQLFAQVGINNDQSAPDPSAMLDVKSSTLGVLLPRVALTGLNDPSPVTNPAVGLLVYNTALAGTPPYHVTEGYYFWSGTIWVPVSALRGQNQGDMQYWNGVQWVNIPVGLPGQFLQLSQELVPSWTGASFPLVITNPTTSVTQNSAVSGGQISSDGGSAVTSRGVCWNTAGNPTILDQKTTNGSGTGNFVSNLSGLTAGTKYYIRAYAINQAGTGYGQTETFTTLNVPSVQTDSLTGISQNSAQAWGMVTLDGGAQVTSRGFCWSTDPGPTTNDSKINTGTGTGPFNGVISNLTVNTQYYIRTFATNSIGTAYGAQIIFSTLPPVELPQVSTDTISNITNMSASGGGEVIFDGYAPVTERGICWSLTANPTITGPRSSDGSGTGPFTSMMTGLMADTVYYVRAYATNSLGTGYGNTVSFRTLPDAPPPCPGIPVVTYEGKTYNTVLIGSQCWLKENLDIGTRINGSLSQSDNNILEKYCLNDLPANCDVFGGLYQWNEACQYIELTGAKGICPDGWHIPSFSELNTLISYLGGTSAAGGKLKETGMAHWSAPNTGANNRSGFTALPGAFRTLSGTFEPAGTTGRFWSSSHETSGFAALVLYHNTSDGDVLLYAENTIGYSVRCIKDTCSNYSSSGVSISPSVNPVCEGNSVTLTATPVNGGSSPFYQWKVNGQKVGLHSPVFTFVPVNNDEVTCVMYSSAPCADNPATSQPVILTVSPRLTVGCNITANSNPVCAGTQVTFSATAVNGGTSPSYQWTKNNINIPGATNSTYTYTPANDDAIRCIVASALSCVSGNPATSSPVTMTVNPLNPVSVSITPSSGTVCAGTSVTFTAIPVNGGSAPQYQWKKGGANITGATNVTYTYVPANNDQVSCVMTSTISCASGNPATSNTITMTVNPLLPVSVTINASANNICAGTQVSFTATATNGGSNPAYQWKKGGVNITGATNATYSYTPSNNDLVTCVVTSNAACVSGNPATSNQITMVVNPLLPVSVTISASAGTVCAGTNVIFTATPVNGGSSPGYQWKKGGTSISGATGSTYAYTPANGDAITCVLTSSAPCTSGNPATSNTVNMVVNPIVPVSVSITASANNICAGTNVTFTATPVNGGTSPVYQWKKNGSAISGATGATYAYAPANNDAISCVLTSSASCISGNPATSNTITMTVNPTNPVSVTISASANNICQGTSVTFTATPVNGGTAPGYQWKKNGSNISGATGSAYTYIPANNDIITCILTSNISCPTGNPATSNTITMVVNPVLPVSISITASENPSCQGETVTYTATPVNGGTNPAYQWKLNNSNIQGATNSTYTFIPSNNNKISCVLTSGLMCTSGNPATSNQITQSVQGTTQVSLAIAASANPVCSGTQVTFTATPVNGGTSPSYQWIISNTPVPGATNSTYSFTPVNNNTVKCEMYSSINCPTPDPAESNTITMTVNPTSPVSVTITASSYAVVSGTQVTYTAYAVNGGTSPVFNWKKNGTTVQNSGSNTYTYTPANNDNIHCIMTSSLTACITGNPATSNTINMIVYTTGTPCTGVPTVTHGGMTYHTVQVGSQCWLRENLNIGTRIDASISQTNNGVIEKYCYNNDTNMCHIYGGLYQWAEMVQYLNGASNTAHWNPVPTGPVQGLCPPGWHHPTNSELTTFYSTLGGTGVAGGKMKELGTVHWNSPNSGAANTYGLTFLPSGYYYNGEFNNLGTYANQYTVSTGSAGSDVYWYGAAYNSSARLAGQAYKVTAYAARCLKD